MNQYFHSVTLDRDKCKGCTNCLRGCPTEAIRVRDGKAAIIAERCIDCGECIRACPYHAKVARTDPLSALDRFRYRIALPAPSLYGQFRGLDDTRRVLSGLMDLGFDDVFEVARGADIVTRALMRRLRESTAQPLISSACPAVMRLIQVRFPGLLGNIVDLQSPMEVAAQTARREFCERRGVSADEVGTFFITPCPAKMTSIRNPLGMERSHVDGAISIIELYGPLSARLAHPDKHYDGPMATLYGVGWANSGGESTASGCDDTLAVDGIHNVIRVLEEIENGKLPELRFFEGLACTGGCVGGPLVFENAYVAKDRIRRLVERMPRQTLDPDAESARPGSFDPTLTTPIREQRVLELDEDLSAALEKMGRVESITESLPGLDCGSCGAPSCRALAEDIVQGKAAEIDCIFRLRDKVARLAREMKDLAQSDSRKE
ncbi:MAG: 4Fe-4S dicluster domain-containing protein [Clostridiales bacterium]|nr:4Fe-4S dicluster domain-containing protein [Clostridiales bacterium]